MWGFEKYGGFIAIASNPVDRQLCYARCKGYAINYQGFLFQFQRYEGIIPPENQ